MGKRTLQRPGMDPTPFVQLTNTAGTPGAGVTGKVLALGREVKMKKGSKYVYEIAIQDTVDGTHILKKQADGTYAEYKAKVNERVAVFLTELLHKTILAADPAVKIGDVLKLDYHGRKPTKNGGNTFHDVSIEVLE